MRTSAITAAVLALSICGTVNANDDFSALLADLSFGDAPAPCATASAAPASIGPVTGEPAPESLTVVQEQTLQDLLPLPSGFVLPGMLESTPEMVTDSEGADLRSLAQSDSMDQSAPQVALMDPIPASVPVETIDFDEVFALQDSEETAAATVSHVLHGHLHGNDCATCDQPQEGFCRPRNPVHLPSSTLYQYFRSHPCYSNVWDGYGIYCGDHHKHLHGECDCFKSKGHKACDAQERCDGGSSR